MSHPNSRGERRALSRKLDRRTDHKAQAFRRYGIEKNWKKIYLRSNKLQRARQLGKIWPHREWKQLMADTEPLRVLFVCSRNRLRSPTGEVVFNEIDGVDARSGGTARDADHQVDMDDIKWANLIVCMEPKHANRLKADFRQAVAHKRIRVINVPDDYKFMQDELVSLLHERVMPLIGR